MHIGSYLFLEEHVPVVKQLSARPGNAPCPKALLHEIRDWGSNMRRPVSNPRHQPFDHGGFLEDCEGLQQSVRKNSLIGIYSVNHLVMPVCKIIVELTNSTLII